MRSLVRGSAALAFVMFVVSCSSLLKKKGVDDAGVEASTEAEVVDAAPPPAAAALATNEGDVARFPDEAKLGDVKATLQRTYNVREAPPAGVIVVGLPKGITVTQVAQRDKSFLIVFDDPKAPGTKLMGWIHRDAFSIVVADAGPLECAKGEMALFGDTTFCGKPCSADAECPAGQACKGQANKSLPNGKAGDGVTICVLYHPHDAGAPVALDAGKASVADAGHPGVVDAGKVVDAGTPPKPDAAAPAPTPTGPAADVVAPTGGKCPDSFVLVAKTNKCHRSCANGTTVVQRLASCRNAKPLCIKCDKDEKKVCADTQDQCR